MTSGAAENDTFELTVRIPRSYL